MIDITFYQLALSVVSVTQGKFFKDKVKAVEGNSNNTVDSTKNWKKLDGSINWPENDGFFETPSNLTLKPGTKIDRYGNSLGKFVSPTGTPYEARSLAPGTENSSYHSYRVIKPINVLAGKTAPWFDQPGGGIQYKLPMTIQELIDLGYLMEDMK